MTPRRFYWWLVGVLILVTACGPTQRERDLESQNQALQLSKLLLQGLILTL